MRSFFFSPTSSFLAFDAASPTGPTNPSLAYARVKKCVRVSMYKDFQTPPLVRSRYAALLLWEFLKAVALPRLDGTWNFILIWFYTRFAHPIRIEVARLIVDESYSPDVSPGSSPTISEMQCALHPTSESRGLGADCEQISPVDHTESLGGGGDSGGSKQLAAG